MQQGMADRGPPGPHFTPIFYANTATGAKHFPNKKFFELG